MIERVKNFAKWIERNPGKSGTAAGWFMQGCTAASAFILIPVLLHTLGSAKTGLWFTFQSLFAGVTLADCGIGFAITRQAAYCLGTDQNKGKEDFLPIGIKWQGIRNLAEYATAIYLSVIILVLIIGICIYEIIFPKTKLLTGIDFDPHYAWYSILISAALWLYSSRWSALLIGIGHLTYVRLLAGFYAIMQTLFILTAAYYWKSFNCVSFGMLLATLCYVVLLNQAFRLLTPALAYTGRPRFEGSLFLRLLKVAAPVGWVNISAFLVTSIQVPLLGSLLGPTIVTPFYLTQKISQFLTTASLQTLFPQLPQFTRSLSSQNYIAARSTMRRSIIISSAFVLGSSSFFLLAGPLIVELIGNYNGLPYALFVLMAIDSLLMGLSSCWGQYVLALGKNPFVISTTVAGFLNLIFCYILISPMGIIALPLSSLMAGILTNYTLSPFLGVREWLRLKIINSCEN